MAKREFLELAHKLDVKKHSIGGWWYSEKLDGERAMWDGGVSTGFNKSEIPWANTAKDERYVKTQVCTGLWSRYGNIIHAPRWFTNSLPRMPLDGELWSPDRRHRQFVHSTIKKIEPSDYEWKQVVYMVFQSPPLETVFVDGLIDNTNYKKLFKGCEAWIRNRNYPYLKAFGSAARYESVYKILGEILEPLDKSVVRLNPQHELPYSQTMAVAALDCAMSSVLALGGEGLMVRDPNATYQCARSHKLLKYKPFDDMEGTVVGYITGRETDKGSKLLGMMGALILRLDSGNRLELSGFTDEERRLSVNDKIGIPDGASRWAVDNPEKECPDWIEAYHFPRGSRVTFKYRGLSADGIPQEARYWRQRNDN